ncbi:MAG: Mur ligase family protein [Thermomicrobiales bacterium]|nr:Mur ligase family protein [Thermomicrobiales bacterium]MCO5218083.1 Mur ligase family protein [Thermomicrobiales bacterium]MCO5226417.1 Mur ligase family protein [Thermomicrobiales bacterium]MCO5227199.1 Mur ligase family protein [Thermomicrobiales bacterium]
MTETYQRYHAAARRMDALIEMTPTPTDSSREAIQERAVIRMDRLRAFLAKIGNPQLGRPLIHVGGTSGKGSTSTIIAAMLTAAGYRTGLHTSPYLQTPAEKLQVDGRLIGPDAYADLVDEFFLAHDAWIAAGNPPLTYGEGFNALMWMYFRREQVDIGVVEVGAGGRFDLTNILQPTLCVITSVGIDHTQTLGHTIPEIAWHKAGIIKSGVPVVSGVPDPEAQAVIRSEAESVGAPLQQLNMGLVIRQVATGPAGTSWAERPEGIAHHMRMAGSFQARNGQLAIAAMRRLREEGFAIADEAIATGLRQARIPGRAELVDDRVPVILDGAHNAEKLAAFASDIPFLLPATMGKRIVVSGLLESKQGDTMLASLAPVMDMLIATSPRVYGKDARSADEIEEFARQAGYHGPVKVESDPEKAIALALRTANPGIDAVIVTGSLYLVGNVRGRWFPETAILRTQSPWAAPLALTR